MTEWVLGILAAVADLLPFGGDRRRRGSRPDDDRRDDDDRARDRDG
ncbi:hypothetical protein MF406_09025 [Georgenia sp. TF02-10]|nr:hypothetical protein [Georgenia sp. TF02-10]UNX53180.1 hypothetical protein MF406_09025 [Georgenia sp. TF02-10]